MEIKIFPELTAGARARSRQVKASLSRRRRSGVFMIFPLVFAGGRIVIRSGRDYSARCAKPYYETLSGLQSR
ncbi:MAG: hypothetical protein ACK4NA_08210 [Alphaproteobacteria bacterium]